MCIATVFVPIVESGERVVVPKVELAEQRFKVYLYPKNIFFLYVKERDTV